MVEALLFISLLGGLTGSKGTYNRTEKLELKNAIITSVTFSLWVDSVHKDLALV